MPRLTRSLICSFIILTQAVSLFANETSVLGSNIGELYEKGNYKEARKRLVETLSVMLPSQPVAFSGKSKSETISHMATSVQAAGILAMALTHEKRHIKDAALPADIIRIVRVVNSQLRAGSNHISGSDFAGDAQVKRKVDYYNRIRLHLLRVALMLYRNMDRQEEIEAIRDENSEFLKAQGLPFDQLLPNFKKSAGAADSEAELGRTWFADGPALELVHLIIEYYRGLSLEDPVVLNQCLYGKDGYMNGESLLTELQKERRDEGFEKILMPLFDTKTRVSVQPQPKGLYRATVSGVMVRLSINGKVITQRQSDDFMIKRTDDRLWILRKDKDSKNDQ